MSYQEQVSETDYDYQTQEDSKLRSGIRVQHVPTQQHGRVLSVGLFDAIVQLDSGEIKSFWLHHLLSGRYGNY